MQIHLSDDDPQPKYAQIVRQVKYLVATGRLAPGDELPPIRALADELLINPNTVARAYRELEQAGIVVKRQTTGTYVSEAGCALAHQEKIRILTEHVDQLLVEARRLSVDQKQLLALIRDREQAMSVGQAVPNSGTA